MMRGRIYDGLPDGFTIEVYQIETRTMEQASPVTGFRLYKDGVFVARGLGSIVTDPLSDFVLPHSRPMLEAIWAAFQTTYSRARAAARAEAEARQHAEVAAVLGLPVEAPDPELPAGPAHARD